MADTKIEPMPHAIGLNMSFVAQQPTFLVLKERLSFSGDDFTIQNASGQDVVRCEGKALSISGRKSFITPNGQHLFTLRKETFSFPRSWYLEGPAGEKFCAIDGKWTFGKAKLDISFKNVLGDGQNVKLLLRGQFFDRSADLTDEQGRVVAKIRREFLNMREIFAGGQTYGVEVAPGVDLALIAAIVVAVDEQRNEK